MVWVARTWPLIFTLSSTQEVGAVRADVGSGSSASIGVKVMHRGTSKTRLSASGVLGDSEKSDGDSVSSMSA